MNRNHLTLKQQLRTGHVKRWQIVRVAREQTIAEHMYRVYLVTKEICSRLKVSLIEEARAIEWALAHDLTEVITGDVATPTKRMIEERAGDPDLMLNIELWLDEPTRKLYRKIEQDYPIALRIVKLADDIEAVDFLSVEGMGGHASEVKRLIDKKIDDQIESAKTRHPNFDWHRVINEIRQEIQQ
jgi:5'-deoxynucleotidase YfbR-like HD superfamily hydrolase